MSRNWPRAVTAAVCVAVLVALAGGDDTPAPAPAFTDVPKESGVEKVVADKYAADPKWWHSGLPLVDLDGDGPLDLFLSAHGGGRALALLNDGTGHFAPAPGDYPATEIHLA